jgi:hypothetical protein
MLINFQTGKPIKFPKLKGEAKRRADYARKAGSNAARHLIKALKDPSGLTPI